MDATEGTYVDRIVAVLADIATAIAGLDRLDDERKGDIDELREEVAALGARVDALVRYGLEPGLCPHGVSFAPGVSSEGRSRWCGECFPDPAEIPA